MAVAPLLLDLSRPGLISSIGQLGRELASDHMTQHSNLLVVIYSFFKLDGPSPVDNRPSTDKRKTRERKK